MSEYTISRFMSETCAAMKRLTQPADYVEAIAPMLHRLINGPRTFLKPEHFREDDDHYARHAVYVDSEGGPSLYALVWKPGQWTPVHDHGTWGIVGVIQGVLEEQNFIRVDKSCHEDTNIELRRGGPILLGEGTVTTFVPNPDHIHKTGVPEYRKTTVSLHLYGQEMNAFNVYDVGVGTRQRIDVSHNVSFPTIIAPGAENNR